MRGQERMLATQTIRGNVWPAVWTSGLVSLYCYFVTTFGPVHSVVVFLYRTGVSKHLLALILHPADVLIFMFSPLLPLGCLPVSSSSVHSFSLTLWLSAIYVVLVGVLVLDRVPQTV